MMILMEIIKKYFTKEQNILCAVICKFILINMQAFFSHGYLLKDHSDKCKQDSYYLLEDC